MPKGIILLNNGFEDVEAIATIDVIRRAGISIETFSLDDVNITTQTGINMKSEKLYKDIKLDSYDFLVIPGGGAVFKYLHKRNEVSEIIKNFAEKKKLVASICAAPSLVGKLGYFKNKKFTCFPGCEEGIEGKYTGNGVEVVENFITAKSMAYAIDFSLEIVRYLLGKEVAKKVEKSIYASK